MDIITGAVVPLSLQLPNDNPSVFVRAQIVDAYDDPVSGSPVNLAYGTNGNYFADTFIMPDLPFIKAIYTVYTDSGYTMRSGLYGLSSSIFNQVIQAPSSQISQTITGTISQNNSTCYITTKPIQIVQGANALFEIRFLNSLTGDPIDLTNATVINVQFLNTDGTLLTVALGTGVVIVTPFTIGKISVSATPTQTALLQYGLVPLAVTMVISTYTYVVQFPQAVNVQESVFS